MFDNCDQHLNGKFRSNVDHYQLTFMQVLWWC